MVARLTARRYANAVYTLSLYQSSRLSVLYSTLTLIWEWGKATNRTQMPAPHRDALLYILMIAVVVQDSWKWVNVDLYSAIIMKVSNALYTWNIIIVKVFEQFLCYFFATCDGDEHILRHGCCYHTVYVVSNCCLSLNQNIAGLWQGRGKMLLGSWKVQEFGVADSGSHDCDRSSTQTAHTGTCVQWHADSQRRNERSMNSQLQTRGKTHTEWFDIHVN